MEANKQEKSREELINGLDEQLSIIGARIYDLEMALQKERKEFVIVRQAVDYLKS